MLHPLFRACAAGALALSCALPALAADTVTLNYTAKLRWGGQSGPATSAVLTDVPVTVGSDGFFNVSGTITLGLTAPNVIGFGPASGYFSEEALQGYTMTVGSRTFNWVNQPGTLNNRWGITISEGGATGDLLSTANSALPAYGGISPAINPTAAGNGLMAVTQPNTGGTRDNALGSVMFWLAGAGLVTSNTMSEQTFAGLSGLSYGDSNAPAGTVATRLLVQFLALPTGSTETWQHTNAQNADGYFTSLSVAAVPEPATALLMLGGVAGMLAMRRLR